MIKADFHVHSRYCDGADTLADMAAAAYAQGLTALGFSGHSPTGFDLSYAMDKQSVPLYRREIAALSEQYRGRMEIFCGVEQDYFAEAPAAPFDYMIGSVHYVRPQPGVYVTVDDSPEQLLDAVQRYYQGDIYALIEDYYRLVGDVIQRTEADIIGHFDLVGKFNEGGRLFDERHPRYQAAVRQALARLLPQRRPFEINTGAMARGWRSTPYPAEWILREIARGGGCIVLSGDSHAVDTLCYGFDAAERLARDCGFIHALVLSATGWKQVKL